MIDKILKLNIRLLISYVITVVCTYYIGFGAARLIIGDILKLITIVGTFIISFALSLRITQRILPMKKKSLIKNRLLSFLCTAILSLFVVIALAHMLIWAISTDVISADGIPDYHEFLKTPGISSVKYYAGGVIDGWELFKFEADSNVVKDIATKLHFIQIDTTNSSTNDLKRHFNGFGLGKKSQYWWSPKWNDKFEYYKFVNPSQTPINGEMMYDPKSNTVYLDLWSY